MRKVNGRSKLQRCLPVRRRPAATFARFVHACLGIIPTKAHLTTNILFGGKTDVKSSLRLSTSKYRINGCRFPDVFFVPFFLTMSDHVDEETPLLAGNGKKQATPLPWFQFTLILILQLAEPLTSNVIYPFAPEVCSSFLLGSTIN